MSLVVRVGLGGPATASAYQSIGIVRKGEACPIEVMRVYEDELRAEVSAAWQSPAAATVHFKLGVPHKWVTNDRSAHGVKLTLEAVRQ